MALQGFARTLRRVSLALVCVVSASACVASIGDPEADDAPPIEPAAPAFTPAAGNLRRLTTEQYRNVIKDLLGPDIVVPPRIEPDARIEGLLAVGAGITSFSDRGVEQFESAAYDIARQALAPGPSRDRLVPCQPWFVIDPGCAEAFVRPFGRAAFRRPLTEQEVQSFVDVAGYAAPRLGDFYRGLEFAMAAMLQSPYFVFRVEIGEPDPANPGRFRYDAYELATRMSFFAWNSTPDAALIDAAENGVLDTDEGYAQELARLLADERARGGVRAFFADMLRLAELEQLNKDPVVYVHFSPEVGQSAREETLLGVEHLVFDRRADYREFLTTRTSFVDRQLASIYNVPAPTLLGHGQVEFPSGGLRAGFLGQVSFLGLQAHAASSSATLRGKFVREVFLCAAIPPPPANANTAIPEATEAAPTLRDRVLVHFENPTCRSCHQLMDPMGLAFENFDGIGRFRTTENDARIDPSGSLNGTYFEDAAALAEVLYEEPDVPRCLVRTMYRYATGHVEVTGETAELRALTDAFASVQYDVLELMRLVAMRPGFRTALPPDSTEETE